MEFEGPVLLFLGRLPVTAYALCLAASFVPLLVGAMIFRANQDKFVLNL